MRPLDPLDDQLPEIEIAGEPVRQARAKLAPQPQRAPSDLSFMAPYEQPGGFTDPPAPVVFKTAAQFCGEYVPLSYTVESLLRSSSVYTITAKTGAGKTAFMVVMAQAVATGRPDILGREVVTGRVAYLAFENPDDVRMRLMIAAYLLNIDLTELGNRLVILDVRRKPEEIVAALARLAEVEPFALVVLDTFAGGFDGDDVNNPVQGGEFVRRLRPITRIGGMPSVVVAAHPVKNASEEQLIPYGSGAILNEVDGNLTLWKAETGIVKLHWQGKLRGLEFQPVPFRFEIVGSPDVLDDKDRQVQLPVLRPATAADDEARQTAELNLDAALLRVMLVNPGGTQADWGAAIGVRHRGSVNKRLARLKAGKLTDDTLGRWSVTPKGRKALEPHE